jgi:hypothetical protein
MMRALLAIAFASVALGMQQAPSAPPIQPPWFRLLGVRSLEMQASLPVIDQVVLVPDAATYIDEVSRWTTQARWPVLIEDNAFAPRFVRAFKPAVVLRRASVRSGADPAGAELRAKVESAIAKAWDGQASDTVANAYKNVGLTPAGIVAASTSDPAWTAALALAAGRGQLIAWIDGDYGGLSTQLTAAQFTQLESAVNAAFESSGLPWNSLGDKLEAFTLCRNVALRANIPDPPGGWNSRLPPRGTGPIAVTDALCRTPTGGRYAFAGQICGDSTRAAYAAMCSLFLSRTSLWMFDGYGDRTDEMFAQYGFGKAAEAMSAQGFSVAVTQGAKATAAAWKSLLPAALDADVVMVNSAGNSDFFQIGQHDNLWSTLVPLLNRPVALSMVHSFSLQMPDQQETVGWRWLEHGVYAYVGSVHEPYVVAFVPPRVVLERVLNGTPFLIASRQWEGDIIPQTWRIATLGDPLMTIASPAILKQMGARKPAVQPVAPDGGYVELRALAKSSMEATRTATDGAAYAQALRALLLLGDDKIAAQLFAIAHGKGQGPAVARDALGPLFRMKDRDGFMKAWILVDAPSNEDRDMLWALWAGGLGSPPDRAAATALQRAVRTPRADMDASFLVDPLKRLIGREAVAAWINQLIAAERDPDGKRRLAELQGKL